ncbi:MAG: helix-turn-helix transcriptional regulator [Clostridiales bacterium]|nr:helix-turn-helix transcriptional regulator [Clostridiales bacterium]
MIHPYDITYLENAKASLAGMLEYSVSILQYDADEFFDLFISSGTAALFEQGDIRTLAGMSGTELSHVVLERSGLRTESASRRFNPYRTNEYRAGICLAHYQWERGITFSEITEIIPVSSIAEMCDNRYRPYEGVPDPAAAGAANRAGDQASDSLTWFETRFFDHMNDCIRDAGRSSGLKSIRLKRGLSQRELAELTGIPLRTIQQYEQLQKNINKAQFEYIVRLSSALKCEPLQLMERF